MPFIKHVESKQKFPYFIQESHSSMFQDKSEYGVAQEKWLSTVMNSTGQCFSGRVELLRGHWVTGPPGKSYVISLNRKCQVYHCIFMLTSTEKKQFNSPFFSLWRPPSPSTQQSVWSEALVQVTLPGLYVLHLLQKVKS